MDASPQKFHKMNCKVSQQSSGLARGHFIANLSQNELQSFAAKVRSCLHCKSFTKQIAMFRSKGPVLSVNASPQNELQSFAAKFRSCQWMLHSKSFTKWIAKFRSKAPVLPVNASPQTFHKMNCKVSQQRSGRVSEDASTQQFHK